MTWIAWPCYNNKRAINHQPGSTCYSIPFRSWWNDNLMLTVAETPTGVARALLYIVRSSPCFLLPQSYKKFYHTFHQVMSPDRRAYLLKKHSIVYSYDRLPRTTTSLPPAKVGTTKYNWSSTITSNQQPNATRYHLVVDGIIIIGSQWFAQLPTILTYMLLTMMHRTCNVLHASMETYHFLSNHSISWYLPLSKPYSQPPEPSQGNAHTFLSRTVEYRGWWWWTTMGFISGCWTRYTSLRNFHFHKTLVTSEKSGVLLQDPSLGGIAVRPKILQKKGRQTSDQR